MPILDNAIITVLCPDCKKDVLFEAKDATQRNFRTIKCDSPGCTKEVLYDRKDEKAIFENPENSWLKTTRIVQSADGRNIVYCSDTCEVTGTATGKHNVPEPPKIVTASNPAAVVAAAQAAANARAQEAAIRAGQPAKVQLTD
jgi:hypothetical protein